MMNIKLFLKRDMLFTVSGLLAVIACLLGRLSLEFIDFHVILTLLGLMAVIKVLERLGVLDYFAEKIIQISHTNRSLIRNLAFLAFFSSMILTNDIAILTLLPVFLKIVQKTPQFKEKIIGTTLIIIAANLGSSCLPFGNPQNLYLFAYYQMSFRDFLVLLLPFFGLSIVALLVACQFIPNKQLEVVPQERRAIETRALVLPTAAMIVMILSVLHLFPYQLAVFLAILAAFFSDREALKEVDYRLLGTFVFFFLIVGNLGEVSGFVVMIRRMLGSFTSVMFSSALISQVISNVPAALLLAPFTKEAHALVLGVNIGGLGTLIASLANLIGYKVFAVYFVKEKKQLVKTFTIINGIFLVIFLVFFYGLQLIGG